MSKTEITIEELPVLFESVADIFAKEKECLPFYLFISSKIVFKNDKPTFSSS